MRRLLLASALMFLLPSGAAAQRYTTSHQDWGRSFGRPGHSYHGNGHHTLDYGGGRFHYEEMNAEVLNRRYDAIQRREPRRRGPIMGAPGYGYPIFGGGGGATFMPEPRGGWMNPDYVPPFKPMRPLR